MKVTMVLQGKMDEKEAMLRVHGVVLRTHGLKGYVFLNLLKQLGLKMTLFAFFPLRETLRTPTPFILLEFCFFCASQYP
jgi:hypothetical protein